MSANRFLLGMVIGTVLLCPIGCNGSTNLRHDSSSPVQQRDDDASTSSTNRYDVVELDAPTPQRVSKVRAWHPWGIAIVRYPVIEIWDDALTTILASFEFSWPDDYTFPRGYLWVLDIVWEKEKHEIRAILHHNAGMTWLFTWDQATSELTQFHPLFPSDRAYSPDRGRVKLASNSVWLFPYDSDFEHPELIDGRLLEEFDFQGNLLRQFFVPGVDLHWSLSTDFSTAYFLMDMPHARTNAVTLDINSGTMQSVELEEHAEFGLSFSPNGEYVLCVKGEWDLLVASTVTGEVIFSMRDVNPVGAQFLCDERFVVVTQPEFDWDYEDVKELEIVHLGRQGGIVYHQTIEAKEGYVLWDFGANQDSFRFSIFLEEPDALADHIERLPIFAVSEEQ